MYLLFVSMFKKTYFYNSQINIKDEKVNIYFSFIGNWFIG